MKRRQGERVEIFLLEIWVHVEPLHNGKYQYKGAQRAGDAVHYLQEYLYERISLM